LKRYLKVIKKIHKINFCNISYQKRYQQCFTLDEIYWKRF